MLKLMLVAFTLSLLLLGSAPLQALPDQASLDSAQIIKRLQRWAERAEASEAAQTIDVSPQALQSGIREAARELKEYLAVRPDDTGALVLLARLGRAEIMASPIEIQARQGLEQVEAKRRERVDQLAAYCDRALALDPGKADAYYWKARLYGIRHFGTRNNRMAWVYVDLNLAAQFARRSVELDPQKLEYRETLAQYLVLNKQLDEAMNVMREVAGGKHSIYLLLKDQKALPLPPGAALLEEGTENTVQGAIEGGWKKFDFIPLRIRMYVVPMSAPEVQAHYQKIWPKFQFFKLGSRQEGRAKVTDYQQFFRWKEETLKPAAEKRELPRGRVPIDDAKEGLVFTLTEVQDMENHAPFPISVGRVFCVFTIRNYRPAMERWPQADSTTTYSSR